MSDTDTRYDHVFRNALVFDGTGAPPFTADVAVNGERIAAVEPPGTIAAAAGRSEKDIAGRALSPGFIDAHTHDDRIVLDAPDMLPKISQGVTTVVAGNCGISLAPVTFDAYPPAPLNLLGGPEAYQFPRFADYARAIADIVPAVNVAALIGHSSLRLATMPDVKVPATPGQIEAMLDLADEA
ncbi:MAG: amidohydrolase family protein, partial [Microthrixaceae bacterium]|nr:amidohydrolase family protein [Microthrixaceae bacterium]